MNTIAVDQSLWLLQGFCLSNKRYINPGSPSCLWLEWSIPISTGCNYWLSFHKQYWRRKGEKDHQMRKMQLQVPFEQDPLLLGLNPYSLWVNLWWQVLPHLMCCLSLALKMEYVRINHGFPPQRLAVTLSQAYLESDAVSDFFLSIGSNAAPKWDVLSHLSEVGGGTRVKARWEEE